MDDHPLQDYWNVLTRRWYVVFGTLVAAVIGGFLYFRSLPVQPFPYTTVVEVGNSENPKQARAKITGAYAPQALFEHAQKQGYEQQRYAVTVELTANSNLLTLLSTGSESGQEDLLGIQQRIIDLLLANHRAQEEILRANFRSQKFRAELELEGLKQTEKFFPARFRRLDERAALLKEQTAEAEDFLTDLQQKRAVLLASQVQKSAGQGESISTFFILDNDIQRQREKKRSLEQELNLTLRLDRERVEQDQIENKRSQKERQKGIDDVQLSIDTFKITKVLFPPQRQLRKSQAGSLNFVGASAILGLLLGLVAAFFVEFAINARKELRPQ